MADDVCDDFPAHGDACAHNLDRILSSYPYLAHVFLYNADKGFVNRSQPYRMKQDTSFRTEGAELGKMMEGWLSMDHKEVAEKVIHAMRSLSKPNYTFFRSSMLLGSVQ